MSANEPGLIALLLAAKSSPAEKTLHRIVALYKDNDRMNCHDLRVLEIVLEGLGVPPPQRRYEIQAAIQRKRDRQALLSAEREGVTDAPP